VITKVDSQSIRDNDDLDRVINQKKIGDRVEVEVYRNQRRMTFTVQLSDPPTTVRR
jgi:S1-C subfamily serine protease